MNIELVDRNSKFWYLCLRNSKF